MSDETNEQQGIVERCAARLGVTLVDPDRNVYTRVARGLTQLRNGGAWDGHRLIEQLRVESAKVVRLAGRDIPDPQWIPRDKCFREHDEARASRSRLGDGLTSAIDRRVAIEKRGADLHCRDEEWLIGRIWHCGSIEKKRTEPRALQRWMARRLTPEVELRANRSSAPTYVRPRPGRSVRPHAYVTSDSRFASSDLPAATAATDRAKACMVA